MSPPTAPIVLLDHDPLIAAIEEVLVGAVDPLFEDLFRPNLFVKTNHHEILVPLGVEEPDQLVGMEGDGVPPILISVTFRYGDVHQAIRRQFHDDVRFPFEPEGLLGSVIERTSGRRAFTEEIIDVVTTDDVVLRGTTGEEQEGEAEGSVDVSHSGNDISGGESEMTILTRALQPVFMALYEKP